MTVVYCHFLYPGRILLVAALILSFQEGKIQIRWGLRMSEGSRLGAGQHPPPVRVGGAND